jgi:hypothetical protein
VTRVQGIMKSEFMTTEAGMPATRNTGSHEPMHDPMPLSRLWREHLQAGCPRELAGVEIAGTEARELDAEISACVSAVLSRSITVDDRIERRLAEISTALRDKRAEAEEPVAQYCDRLNKLVRAVLVQSRGGRA